MTEALARRLGLAPLSTAVQASPLAGAAPLVTVGAVAAAGGALLALLLGVSRTVVDPVHGVPRAAELAVATAVVGLVVVADLRGAIGYSSFCVLAYYAVANAAALRLGRRVVPALGLAGCALLALSLPSSSVLGGTAVLLAAVLVRAAVRTARS